MTFHWESFVFAIIAFAILYWLLNRYAFGPLFKIMEQRRTYVQDEIASAENNRKESEKLLDEQKQALQEAREEAYRMLEQARQTSSRQADEMMERARSEANRIKEDALKEIESEKQKAIAQLKNQVSGLSVLIASKIIEKQVDEAANKDLIHEYLDKVGDPS